VIRRAKRTDTETKRLTKASGMPHWTRLDRRHRRQQWLSRALVTVRDRGAQLRQDERLLASLVRSMLEALVGTAALVAALEVLAARLRHTLHWGALFTPVAATSYGGFVATAVGAEAAFLALFFTTVGVIASTTYAKVPGEVRSLFVHARTSLLYVWNVAIALLVGLVLLTMPVVAHRSPHGLTVLVFAVLTAFSVLSLVLLGTELFDFFDLSTLSAPLPRRFVQGLKAASAVKGTIPQEAQQQAAHDRAARVLRIYGQLTDLIEGRDVAEAKAPEHISLELLACWRAVSVLKSAIPTKSQWFSLTPRHPNWLTMDHTQLTLALTTRTDVRPTLVPDPLWVENILADCVGRLLPTLSTQAEWQRAVQVVDKANDLVLDLAFRLQIDEARLLRRTVGTYLQIVGRTVDSNSAAASPNARGGWEVFRLAAAERETIGYTRFWLGLVRPFEQLDAQVLAAHFDSAVATVEGPFAAGAPRRLLELFTDIANGIEFERRTEKQRVTPDWWVRHLAARTLVQILVSAIHDFFSEVQTGLVVPLVADMASDPELTTVRIFDLLELVHKLAFHLGTAHRAIAVLAELRHLPSNDEQWPDESLPDDVPKLLEGQLYRKLGEVAPHLPHSPYESSRPDLFGQSYRRLFDATFHAILQNHTDLARELFPIAITMADRARARLIEDLAAEWARNQVIFGTEPLLDMMELSGYAILISELDGDGVWPTVQALWDRILSGGTAPALAAQLTAVVSAHESVFAITSGGLGRTDRKMELARLMRERGLDRREHLWGEPDLPEPKNPIVAAFATYFGDVPHELADLFIVEYLVRRPDMADLKIPRGAEMLQEDFEYRRNRTDEADDVSGEDFEI